MQIGNPELCDGYRRHSGGQMTSCSRRRCGDGDRRHPGEKITSCGS